MTPHITTDEYRHFVAQQATRATEMGEPVAYNAKQLIAAPEMLSKDEETFLFAIADDYVVDGPHRRTERLTATEVLLASPNEFPPSAYAGDLLGAAQKRLALDMATYEMVGRIEIQHTRGED